LRITDFTKQPAEKWRALAREIRVTHGHTHIGWSMNLHTRKDILIFVHVCLPL
jgi:hypothetical protein